MNEEHEQFSKYSPKVGVERRAGGAGGRSCAIQAVLVTGACALAAPPKAVSGGRSDERGGKLDVRCHSPFWRIWRWAGLQSIVQEVRD